MNLLIMGAPGGGKGTQAEILAKVLNIPTISTGAMLRSAIAEGTELGVQAKTFIDAGNLVPDEVIIGIVIEMLGSDACSKGYILDGFPRTIAQAEAIDKAGIIIDHVLVLEVADEVIIDRVSGRRVCEKCGATFHVTSNAPKQEGICDVCGGKLIIRDDDNTETVKTRLVNYHKQTKPVIDYYKDKLIVVEGVGSVESISQKLLSALEA
ncbi:MAG: adenylate kinase [Eubacteriales bacterium]|nr:adenylate kinase [Eubacteriales bacterium]